MRARDKDGQARERAIVKLYAIGTAAAGNFESFLLHRSYLCQLLVPQTLIPSLFTRFFLEGKERTLAASDNANQLYVYIHTHTYTYSHPFWLPKWNKFFNSRIYVPSLLFSSSYSSYRQSRFLPKMIFQEAPSTLSFIRNYIFTLEKLFLSTKVFTHCCKNQTLFWVNFFFILQHFSLIHIFLAVRHSEKCNNDIIKVQITGLFSNFFFFSKLYKKSFDKFFSFYVFIIMYD